MFKPIHTLSPGAERLHKPCLIFFLLTWIAGSVVLWVNVDPVVASWIDSVLLLAATTCSLLGLARRLPVQNVLMTALVIACIAAGVVSFGTITGMPFGSFAFSGRMGAKMFGTLPWTVPLLWLVIILNARGVAELILRPWRRTEFYGYGVLGVACLLVVLLAFGLDPFAVKVKAFWIWKGGTSTLRWHTAPWMNFLGWWITALLALVFSVPWLINKRPGPELADLDVLILWSLFNLWLALGHAAHQLWLPLGVTLGDGVMVTLLALGGMRASPGKE